jgi:hypothetical protein
MWQKCALILHHYSARVNEYTSYYDCTQYGMADLNGSTRASIAAALATHPEYFLRRHVGVRLPDGTTKRMYAWYLTDFGAAVALSAVKLEHISTGGILDYIAANRLIRNNTNGRDCTVARLNARVHELRSQLEQIQQQLDVMVQKQQYNEVMVQ